MKIMTGTWRVAASGDAAGRAYVVRDQADLEGFQRGDVLIAAQTDVNYVAQMLAASAVLTQEGGRYSHAAIFCRENNIPCIVGIDGLLDEVPHGAHITINTENRELIVDAGGAS